MGKKLILFLPGMLLFSVAAMGQEAVIALADNLIVDGVPKIPASLAETARRCESNRSASLADWHPTKREMLLTGVSIEVAQDSIRERNAQVATNLPSKEMMYFRMAWNAGSGVSLGVVINGVPPSLA